MIFPRLKIVASMLCAFFISAILMGFVLVENDRPYISAQKAGEEIRLVQKSAGEKFSSFASSLMSPIQSFIALKIHQDASVPEEPEYPPPDDDTFNFEPTNIPPESLPTDSYYNGSSSTSSHPSSFSSSSKPRPTTSHSSSSSSIPPPTAVPKPTKAPKPTKVPKPTAVVYPPITTDVRPGTSLEEIMRDVEKRACVPYKLLMAIRTEEGGNKFNNMSTSTTRMYNTLNWWNTSSLGAVCDGLAYSAQSGLVPSDSIGAGQRCEMAIGSQTYDQKIMGIMQISESEQNSAAKYITNTIPGKIDRRVLFDNVMMFAIITKNRAGSFPRPSCTDWPEETVKEVARIHASGSQGTCQYYYSQNGVSGDYCKEIWNLYKTFK